MAKPICFLEFDDQRSFGAGGHKLNLSELFDMFGKMMPDYHVLVSFANNVEGVYRVQVFHEKDFTEIQYNELKELITQSINEIKK